MEENNFIIIKTITKNILESVNIVRSKEDKKLYILKTIKLSTAESNEAKKKFYNELTNLSSLIHENILQYKNCLQNKKLNTLNMLIEYPDNGTLSKLILSFKFHKRYIPENLIWSIFLQLLNGLHYLHENKILHRDLKSDNIFLTKNNIIKIGGFTASKNIDEGMASTQIGTPYYTAPEIWEEKLYDYKCDIWSLGIILYEMTALKLPFNGKDIAQLYENITKDDYELLPDIYSDELKYIVKILLNKDPDKRPNTKDLLGIKIIEKKQNELLKLNKIKHIRRQNKQFCDNIDTNKKYIFLNNKFSKNYNNLKAISNKNHGSKTSKILQRGKKYISPEQYLSYLPFAVHNFNYKIENAEIIGSTLENKNNYNKKIFIPNEKYLTNKLDYSSEDKENKNNQIKKRTKFYSLSNLNPSNHSNINTYTNFNYMMVNQNKNKKIPTTDLSTIINIANNRRTNFNNKNYNNYSKINKNNKIYPEKKNYRNFIVDKKSFNNRKNKNSSIVNNYNEKNLLNNKINNNSDKIKKNAKFVDISGILNTKKLFMSNSSSDFLPYKIEKRNLNSNQTKNNYQNKNNSIINHIFQRNISPQMTHSNMINNYYFQ